MTDPLASLRRTLSRQRASHDQYLTDLVTALRSMSFERLEEVLNNYAEMTPDAIRELSDEDLEQLRLFAFLWVMQGVESMLSQITEDE